LMKRGDANVERGDNSSSGQCPECKGRVSLTPAKLGQFLTCPHCAAQLEVVGINPLGLDWAYDWMWEDDEQEAELRQEEAQVMARAFCPDCDGVVRFNTHARLGQKLVCPHCGIDLVVISVEPLDLDWAYVRTETEWGDIEDEEGW
jgi:alpha-aminoadipate carrier protein LysW